MWINSTYTELSLGSNWEAIGKRLRNDWGMTGKQLESDWEAIGMRLGRYRYEGEGRSVLGRKYPRETPSGEVFFSFVGLCCGLE